MIKSVIIAVLTGVALPVAFLAATYDYSKLPQQKTVVLEPYREPTWSKPLRDTKPVVIPPAPRSPYYKDKRIEWSI